MMPQNGPPTVTPSPLPTQVSVGQAEGMAQTTEGPKMQRFVVLTVNTPAGSGTYFLPAEVAETIAKGLSEAASACRSGITLAKP